MYFKEANKRVFDVRFGSLVVAPSIDIVKEVGPLAAYDVFIEFEKRGNDEFYFQNILC
jgi:Malectin domain